MIVKHIEILNIVEPKSDEEIIEMYRKKGRKVAFIRRLPQNKKIVYVIFEDRRKRERRAKRASVTSK